MHHNTDNVRIVSSAPMVSPNALIEKLPLSEKAASGVVNSRNAIKNILYGNDNRLMVLVGPCSIHDTKAAMEYENNLLKLKEELSEDLLIVMRVYFEKPRTTVGWKGLINDPYLDESFDIDKGLETARKLLVDLGEINMPVGVEYLDVLTPQYLSDLISWGAIGARTTESQSHRELASALSCPVGFKNGTDGNLNMSINAIKACSSPQSFLGINDEGQISTFKAMGNKSSHIILRGGIKPNYYKDDVIECENLLKENGLAARIMIDCSHDNSNQDYRNQGKVIEDITNQISAGNKSIFGLMLESNLFSGKQKILDNQNEMEYGISVTDGCIDWLETHKVIKKLAKKIS